MDLSVELLNGLVIKDPFMIASSHWTASIAVFRQLAPVKPSALTLKTTSDIKGEDGEGGRRDKRQLVDHSRHSFAVFTDGPPTLEFWDTATTYTMTAEARKLLPETVLGLSVLEGEDYHAISRSLDMGQYGYVELNWKYTFRNISSLDLTGIKSDLAHFNSAFSTLPRIIKLPREAIPFLSSIEFRQILQGLHDQGSGLIIANSKRIRVPPSRVSGSKPMELATGVVHGEYLFLETYDSIRSLVSDTQDQSIPVLVASGGITDIAGIVDVFAAGTNAVQLCTALDVRGPRLLHWLREQLAVLCKTSGSFTNFLSVIRNSEETWIDAVNKAHDLDEFGSRVVRGVLQPTPRLKTLIAQTLEMECQNAVEAPVRSVKPVRLKKRYRLVATRGTVSSALLAQRCASRLHLDLVLLSSSSEFRTYISKPENQYDFAILPLGALHSIKKLKLTAKNQPVTVGELSRSIVELVGVDSTQLDDVERVYHFSGLSAKSAMAQLIQVVKPEVVELQSEELLPLFRFWDVSSAILAKPPLSRMYPLLGQAELQKSWGTLWKFEEPVLFVCRREFSEDRVTRRIANYVYKVLMEEKGFVVAELESSASEAMSNGFLRYCGELLGAEKAEGGKHART